MAGASFKAAGVVANGNGHELAIDRFNYLSNGSLAKAWEQPRDMTNGVRVEAPLDYNKAPKVFPSAIRRPVMGLSLFDTSNLGRVLNHSPGSCTPHPG